MHTLLLGMFQHEKACQLRERGCEKRNKSVISICNSHCVVGMPAGARQLCRVTLTDAGECANFLTQHSSVKIRLFVALLENHNLRWWKKVRAKWGISFPEKLRERKKGGGVTRESQTDEETREKFVFSLCLDSNFFLRFCLNIKAF